MMKLKITEVEQPIGSGPGHITAVNANDQQVKIVVPHKHWATFENADLNVGDNAFYDGATHAWRRA